MAGAVLSAEQRALLAGLKVELVQEDRDVLEDLPAEGVWLPPIRGMREAFPSVPPNVSTLPQRVTPWHPE